MKKIAYLSNNQSVNYSFSKLEVKNIYLDENSINTTDDLFLFLLRNKNEFEYIDGILISDNLKIDIRINLVLHIRLNEEWRLDSKPVVLLTDENYDFERFNYRKLELKNTFVSSLHTKLMSKDDWNFPENLEKHFINDKDVVVGLAASGTTPYVIGALKE